MASAGCKKGGDADHQVSGHQGAKVTSAKLGLDRNGEMQLSDGDRCPVCGMSVTKHRKFAGAITTRSGNTYYFCGSGCLIKTWLHPEIFIGEEKANLARAVTREYFGGKTIDAAKAHWVAGSNVVGPMGPAIVPLASNEDVATFKQRHGGTRVFRLGELTDAKWKTITGKDVRLKPHGHR